MTRKPSNEKARPDRILYCVKGYLYLTATVLGLIGLFLLYTVWATRNSGDWWLGWRDPLLGLSNRSLLLLGGVLHVGVAAFLFASRDLTNRLLASLWLGLNHLIYYAGIVTMEPTALPNTERFLAWRLGITPNSVDARWKIFQAYLIVVSAVFLFLLWRRSKRLGNEAWFKHWQESRNHPPKGKPTQLRKAEQANDFTKNTCSHCGGRIAFPRSRVGEQIACPHCAMTITLRERPASMT